MADQISHTSVRGSASRKRRRVFIVGQFAPGLTTNAHEYDAYNAITSVPNVHRYDKPYSPSCLVFDLVLLPSRQIRL